MVFCINYSAINLNVVEGQNNYFTYVLLASHVFKGDTI